MSEKHITIEPGHYKAPPFTDEQLEFLDRMFYQLGTEISERANRAYCTEGSASTEAVATVASVVMMFEPKYVDPPDDTYEGN